MPQRPDPLPFDAIVFDLDGTLVDTETLCNETGIAALRDQDVDLPISFFEALAGIHDAERMRRVEAEIGREIDRERFLRDWDARTEARLEDEGLPLLGGAQALIEAAHAAGLPMAIATSSRRNMAEVKLRHAGLGRWIETLVSVDDIAEAKPAPDAYLEAARLLGVAPDRCLAFEDSGTGAQAAHSAGLTVVHMPPPGEAALRQAHYAARDLAEGATAAGLGPLLAAKDQLHDT
ncbi:HAD family hydrolase [Pseudoroseicyclus aestuarii]|uniref:HAD superfamily hydrolase (TIGR01509 family) n=1 Tax=Pseudoroseicyclus aestuarii TaxID=1795041 RepID=A0A318SUM6_9RHOB|nr:HAD family phosphatase [Pseudoroseicyclus aestuarii]PYE83956.1 HAD superfamily hydrolase (TIGR01509 family) [Pseudoroseicyclus aestuarii]